MYIPISTALWMLNRLPPSPGIRPYSITIDTGYRLRSFGGLRCWVSSSHWPVTVMIMIRKTLSQLSRPRIIPSIWVSSTPRRIRLSGSPSRTSTTVLTPSVWVREWAISSWVRSERVYPDSITLTPLTPTWPIIIPPSDGWRISLRSLSFLCPRTAKDPSLIPPRPQLKTNNRINPNRLLRRFSS